MVEFSTQAPGPGLDPDAASYLSAGASLVRMHAYRIPMTDWRASDTTEALAHFPPGFPTLIAGPIALGETPVQAARTVLAVSAFVTAALFFLLVSAATGPWLGAALVGVVFLTPAVSVLYVSVLSELPFTALMAAILLLMAVADERPGLGWRVAIGMLGAAAVMVRYVGAGIVAAVAIWAICRRQPWRRAVRDLIAVALPSGVALVWWAVRTTHVAGATGIRRFGYYRGVGFMLRTQAARTIADWLVPGLPGESIPVWVSWIVVMVMGGIVLAIIGRGYAGARDQSPRARRLISATCLMAACLGVVTVLSRILADPGIPFDERMLDPMIVLVEIATIVAIMYVMPPARRWLALAGTIWFVASAIVTIGDVSVALEDGGDYAGSNWVTSPTIAWVRANGIGRTLYTNSRVAIYFQTGRASHGVPPVLDPLTLRRFGDRLSRTQGLLVGFNYRFPDPDAAPPDSIAERLRLRRVARLDDGTVWELSSSGDASLPAASGSP